mmetsp:Transcript_19096/g.57216  ORF Transcript_19096/g.57216 Transcript_19096/m.57216 type:complete len:215 (+) Transcript_19096:441-1085(+)
MDKGGVPAAGPPAGKGHLLRLHAWQAVPALQLVAARSCPASLSRQRFLLSPPKAESRQRARLAAVRVAAWVIASHSTVVSGAAAAAAASAGGGRPSGRQTAPRNFDAGAFPSPSRPLLAFDSSIALRSISRTDSRCGMPCCRRFRLSGSEMCGLAPASRCSRRPLPSRPPREQRPRHRPARPRAPRASATRATFWSTSSTRGSGRRRVALTKSG